MPPEGYEIKVQHDRGIEDILLKWGQILAYLFSQEGIKWESHGLYIKYAFLKSF